MKANGGVFLVDDFGRQRMRPQDLLNRWIVPLESRVDYLTLNTGRKIEVPFHALIVFATNLDPASLADEAFLRRIRTRFRLWIPPSSSSRTSSSASAGGATSVSPGDGRLPAAAALAPFGRPLRACQPRDLLDLITALCATAARSRPLRATCSTPRARSTS